MREQLIAAGLWDADDPRDPSESIAAAWLVVEHLMERGMGYTVASGSWPDGTRYHVARFFPNDMSRAFMGDATSPPLAICRAALKSLSEEGE